MDEMVARAERGADVALAVLASLMAPRCRRVLMQETRRACGWVKQRATGAKRLNRAVSE
ncbi:hypothetical protein [Actinoplanes nipponensis]|uniref:hypothetical protein n=1 Tax=Actinoplanes nipponensis TaxID=135950 RepID=UPI0031EA7DAE